MVQRITEEPLQRCKLCRAKAKRLISASNFILKGGGWYSDGYGAPKASSSSSSGGGSDSSSSDTSSSSSKSASSGGDGD